MRLLAPALLACFFFTASLPAQTPAAITTDPAPGHAHPAALETFQLPSHGSQLNALMYIAAGAVPHPTVILLHGFPTAVSRSRHPSSIGSPTSNR